MKWKFKEWAFIDITISDFLWCNYVDVFHVTYQCSTHAAHVDQLRLLLNHSTLARERSRDFIFTTFVPWFQIQNLSQTLTQTLTNTPNHTIILTRSQTLTKPRNEILFSFSRALVTWPPKSSFSPIHYNSTHQGCIFTPRHQIFLKN